MTRLLARMVDASQIRVTKIHQNAPQFFHLPETKAPTLQGFQHELAAANIYVAYDTTGKLEQWHWEPHEEYLSIGLKPDRVSSIDGKIIFWEVDRGTEVLAVIREKVERYIQLSKLHPERRFHVAFAASKGRAKSILLGLAFNENGDLEGDIQFAAKEYEFANTIFKLYKGGYMRAFSVGFQNEDVELQENGTKVILKKNHLFEVSTVNVPANALALAKSKGIDTSALEKHLGTTIEKEGRVLSAKNKSIIENARNALDELLTADGDKSISQPSNDTAI